MRTMLLASASLLLIGGTALAQNSTGSPLSNSATNTSSANTRSTISPRLPITAEDASVDQFLMHAESAVRRGRTGEAQEALERAETRLLSRSTEASQAGTPYANPRVQAIASARQELGRGDRASAMKSINMAMSTTSSDTMPTGTMPAGTMPGGTMPTSAGSNPMVGPPPAAGVVPGTLGGISSTTGGDNGTGVGTRSKPQASFSGPGANESPGGTNGAPAVGSSGPVIVPTPSQ